MKKILIILAILLPISTFASEPQPAIILPGVQPYIQLYDTYDSTDSFIREQFGVLDLIQSSNLVFESDGTTYTRLVSPGYIQFDAGGATGMVMDSSRNLGINNNYPTTKLDITGVMRATLSTKPTCNSTIKGAMVYDSTNDHFYGCKTGGWTQLD